MTIAASRADAEAAEAVEQHHAVMAGTLLRLADDVAAAARAGSAFEPARDRLVAWATDELVPHALAEEGTLYRVAGQRSDGRLLVEAMLAEHQAIVALVDRLAAADDPVGAAVAAASLRTLFEVHLAKENEQVLPLLLGTPGVSVAALLGGMHELLGGSDEHPREGAAEPAAGGCACGGHDEGEPELDVRVVPHSIRHATIFGALDAVLPGGALVLVADHAPVPLLAQLEQRAPGAFVASWVEEGPDVWRLRLARRDA
ncbi:DUF2249 domain-containing protein [Nocardioides solisilvae]|uniref:DUF2249 domain-containing protein n=1 Tax=Nocardioides solisilvae TaxID=1542435 RepID=UPI000D7478E9|nr:DUF2249 domain-containing protein [Nocardioides solisilvae]